jgi:hypothetical protein
LDVVPTEALITAQFLIPQQVYAQGEGDKDDEKHNDETAHGASIA